MLLNGCALMFDPIDNNLPPIKHIEASEIAPIVIKELSAIGKPKPNLLLQSMQMLLQIRLEQDFLMANMPASLQQ